MTWYEEDVKGLEKRIAEYPFSAETIFYGSSSIRLWESLNADFAEYKPINLGFGGSTLAACDWFFDRIVSPQQPKRMVVYAGDNDLGDGRHPEEVYIFFQQLMARVTERFGTIPFAYISIKPSIARWPINGNIKYANQLIAMEIQKYPNASYIDIYRDTLSAAGKPNPDLFMPDGLHLSPAGYGLWKVH